MLHSKYDEDLGKFEDVTKQVEFKCSTIRNISDQKYFEAPDKTNHDLQMHPQHQNSTPVEGTNQTSQNHLKQPNTTTPIKSHRQIKVVERYGFDIMSYALQVAIEIDSFKPTTYQEVISCSETKQWAMAINEDMESLQKNQTWDLVDLPEGRQVVGCKWIFKKKSGSSTKEVICYKACLVAKGYSQKEGMHYNEIFSQVV